MHRKIQWIVGVAIFGVVVSQLWYNSIKWLFLCEVQWIAGTFLLLLPFLAWKGAPALVRGAYELETKGDGINLALVLMLAASSIIWTAQIELELAQIRLQEPIGPQLLPNIVGLTLLCLGIFANLIATHLVSNESGNGSVSARSWSAVDSGMLIGLIIALIGFVLSEALIFWIKKEPGAHLPQPIAVLLRNIRDDLNCLPAVLKDGYLSNDGKLNAESTHLCAGFLLLITGGVYFAFRNRPLAPLCSLGLLTVALVWFLSGFAFFFQVFRIPASLPVLIWLWLSSRHPKADHFYEVKTKLDHEESGFSDLNFLETDSEGRILVVAAAGGGIQASAWTAQVLSGLKQACDDDSSSLFEKSLRAVSGVSGGSVGLMYFLAAQKRNLSNIQEAAHAAAESSLSEVTHALSYRELGRAFFPFLIRDVYRDRGSALQEAWVTNASRQRSYADELKEATLRTWTQATAEKKLPAIIFNSTIVERGQRLAFSTVPLRTQPGFDGFCEFTGLYPRRDVSILTAARLSASFTFVSPAARPATPERQIELRKIFSDPATAPSNENLHLVDGGYLDNSGITALIQLLHQKLNELHHNKPQSLPKKILVILIDAFPLAKQQYVKPHRGTLFQFWAPLLTLFTVRSAAHDAMAQRELTLFKDALSGIELSWIDFRFSAAVKRTGTQEMATDAPPLSWHLTKAQKKSIVQAWTAIKPKTQQVLDFLKKGTMPPANFDVRNETLIRLTINQSETRIIPARPYRTWTDIWFETGATYRFHAAGTWSDAGRSTGPDGYSDGTFPQNLAGWLRRSPHSNWFALLGCTRLEEKPFVICQNEPYRALHDGELVCFANDVPGFYWNNTGAVTLTITRIG